MTWLRDVGKLKPPCSKTYDEHSGVVLQFMILLLK